MQKNILQKSCVEIVYRNFHQRYLHEFLTKFDENFFILILQIHRIQIKKFLKILRFSKFYKLILTLYSKKLIQHIKIHYASIFNFIFLENFREDTNYIIITTIIILITN